MRERLAKVGERGAGGRRGLSSKQRLATLLASPSRRRLTALLLLLDVEVLEAELDADCQLSAPSERRLERGVAAMVVCT
jgi:hypothetical protein